MIYAISHYPADWIASGIITVAGIVTLVYQREQAIRRDPCREATMTARAAEHGAARRAARAARRRRRCPHFDHDAYTITDSRGVEVYRGCGRCGATLRDDRIPVVPEA